MLLSLSMIFLLGLLLSYICKKLKIPNIMGILFTGIILGPYVCNFLDKSILSISSDLREAALIIILLKAGLSIDIADLKKSGRNAVFLSFVPATFEIIAYVVFAPLLLKINIKEAALMGSVMAAVSPAVVVPKMTKIIDEKYGSDKGIPQMIVAGSSCDDIYVIVLFSTFLNMLTGKNTSISGFMNVPISIILGVLIGILTGAVLTFIFEMFYKKGNHIRNSTKLIILLGISFLSVNLEIFLKPYLAVSGLLSVLSMASYLKLKTEKNVSARLSQKLGKLWIAAELWLFVLVGATVNINYTLKSGIPAIILIFTALLIRSAGVYISLLGSNLNLKEKIFCIFSYIPKATVQAAISSIPLSAGLKCGESIISVAVIGILLSAGVGAFLIDNSYKRLLSYSEDTKK